VRSIDEAGRFHSEPRAGGSPVTLPDPIGDAVRWIVGGGLLAYPTETVWGIGAEARSEAALGRLRAWKGRERDNPVAVLIESPEAALDAGFDLSPAARQLAERFWPGPLMVIVRGPGGLAAGVAREDGGVGLRCSSHPLATALARRLRRESGGLLTTTSLNLAGEPAARTVGEAQVLCGNAEDEPLMIPLAGGEAGGGTASTVVDTCESPPRVLRWGATPRVDLEPVLEALS
jgi:L-threonylcarbamoyladenylate synthase